MSITIDCRMIDSSGIGTFLCGILPFFLKLPYNLNLIGEKKLLSSYEIYPNVKVIECNIKPFSFIELFFFPNIILKKINNSDYYFSPFFNIPSGIKIPVFTTIHDIIFPDIPELCSRAGFYIRMFFFHRAHRISKKIFTVSYFSKSRIEHHLGNDKPVIVVYSAILPAYLNYKNSTFDKKKRNTIVFIGNVKKHKGLGILIDAFLSVKKKGLDYKLIIIGSKDKLRSSDEASIKIQNNSDKDIIFTGHVTEEKKMNYISESTLLVQPSLYEGFGLPPLEAMVLGTHALISDIPVFKEIYSGFPVTFFRSGNKEHLETTLIQLLSKDVPVSPVLSNELLYKYSFEKTAGTIMKELQ